MLTFSKGNDKLDKQTLIFNLPAGTTCPGANICLSMVRIDSNGKPKIWDGPNTEFRCFAASSEVQYPNVFKSRQANLKAIREALANGNCAELINTELQKNLTKRITKVRIHESGDFFSPEYLLSWLLVASANPSIKFYCYSKNLPLFVGLVLPANFYFTASYGGKFDYLIDEGVFPRYSKVFMTEDQAVAAGFKVDVKDRCCFEEGPFALLVHGTQPAGSDWGKAARANRKVQKAKVRAAVAA
jgi:hypothetical protein